MKTNLRNAECGTRNAECQSAFTMIEIAIALAVIAFALVAIIGVLPTGLTVQKDNREDTIVNQDGPYLLEAIRTGAKGLDHLTNFVETIAIENVYGKVIYTNSPNNAVAFPYDGSMTNGLRIVGLLTTPKYFIDDKGIRITNFVSARMRALSGAAVEQGTASPDFAFGYALVPEVTPVINIDIQSTNYCEIPIPPDPPVTPQEITNRDEIAARKLKWVEVTTREKNTFEIKLTFQWPLLPNDRVGPNRQTFRAIASGQQVEVGGPTFVGPRSTRGIAVAFQPQTFVVSPQPPPCP